MIQNEGTGLRFIARDEEMEFDQEDGDANALIRRVAFREVLYRSVSVLSWDSNEEPVGMAHGFYLVAPSQSRVAYAVRLNIDGDGYVVAAGSLVFGDGKVRGGRMPVIEDSTESQRFVGKSLRVDVMNPKRYSVEGGG